MKPRNQLLIVAANSFWNVTSFILMAVFGFIFSVVLTRYLGPADYGRFSYVFSITTMLVLIFNFGSSGSISKYVPRYFSDENNRALAVTILKRLTTLQFLVAIFFVVIAFFSSELWVSKAGIQYLPRWLLVSFFVYIPLICISTTLISFVGASQNYKKITIGNVVSLVVNAVLLGVGIYFKLSLFYFIFINAFTNLLIGVVLFMLIYPTFLNNPKPKKTIDRKEIAHYTILTYINLLAQNVVWSYSEVFFLKRYSSIESVGFYALAFTIASLFSNILTTAQRSVNNAQFELLEQGQEKKSDTMTFLTIKYSIIFFLPLVIFISLIFNNLVILVYGNDYLLVSAVFPFLITALVINIVLSPIRVKINNDNKLFVQMIILMAIGAGINLFADMIFIPRYHLMGAAWANFIGQSVTVIIVTRFILKKQKFNFNFNKVYPLFFINIILATLTFLVYRIHLGIFGDIIYCFLAALLYIKILKLFRQFGSLEYRLALDLVKSLPPSLKRAVRLLYAMYQRI